MESSTYVETHDLSIELLEILYEVKQSIDTDIYSFDFIRNFLSKRYSPNMSMRNCIDVCMKLCFEACDKINPIPYPRDMEFHHTRKGALVEKLMFSHIENYSGKTLFPNLNDVISIETIFLNQLQVLLSHLRLTNIGRCDQYIEYRENRSKEVQND